MKALYFCLFSLLVATACNTQKESQAVGGADYSQKFRPQYHYSPPQQWMNDPNGMVYYEGEYHLFYQHYPDSNVWGPMHWGHAVSEDLVHWENLPIALYPDSLGLIFSGSAVIDWDNTSGLGKDGRPAMVALYTYHSMEKESQGAVDYQTQGLAYSLDKGRTWAKYEGSPVLNNPGIKDFRDPKVFWHESTQKWIMTLAVWDHIRLYSSPNLIDWSFESSFGREWGSHAGVWECPDLFPMKVEGADEEKWVLLLSINPGGPNGGSATQYFVGDFDGKQFVVDEKFKKGLGMIPAKEAKGKVYEDFEEGYGKWKAEGTAFFTEPARGALYGQYFVEGFKGKALVNSHKGLDESIGELTSPAFTIEEDYINFLIGGGGHEGETCMNLWVNGEIVRTATGTFKERLFWESWDVSGLKGKEAHLQVVDSYRGSWGHIMVDHIQFSADAAVPQQEKAYWLDYGADNYAGVTWSGIPDSDGRRLFIGWMSNWIYAREVPTYDWRSAMTIPRSLHLGKDYRLSQRPVKELNRIYGESPAIANVSFEGEKVLELGQPLPPLAHLSFDVNIEGEGMLDIVLANGAEEFIVRIDQKEGQLILDRGSSGLVGFNKEFGRKHFMPIREGEPIRNVELFIDASSIELLCNDGAYAMTDLVFPQSPYTEVQLKSTAPTRIEKLRCHAIRSIWE